jgi:hypothetical protein
VPTLTESFRAPAEMTQKGYVSGLHSLMVRFADLAFPCRHKNFTRPFNNRQTCLDCGAWRTFEFNDDFIHGHAGITIGEWQKGTASPAEKSAARELTGKAARLTETLNHTPFDVGQARRERKQAVRG